MLGHRLQEERSNTGVNYFIDNTFVGDSTVVEEVPELGSFMIIDDKLEDK